MKTCGTCALCCKVLEIEPLAKPAGQWCVHVRKGRGCGVYADRPEPCRTFTCGWLATPQLGDEWKPETAKFLIRDERALGHLCLDVDPGYPAAWRGAAYLPMIKRWSRMVWEQRGCVLVYAGGQTTVVFPEEDIAIGAFDSGQKLMVGYRGAAGRRVPMVRLLDGETVVREWLGEQSFGGPGR